MVRLGKLNLLNDDDKLEAQDIDIENITVYSNYTRRTNYNDIALLKLSKPVVINKYVSPACLYTKDDDPIGLIITGWGTTSLATSILKFYI